jgi:hypothetical protein
MTKKLTSEDKKTVRRGYMGITRIFIPEKSLVVRKMFHCSECGKESIIALNLSAKYLKKLFDEKKEVSEEDINEVLKDVFAVPEFYPSQSLKRVKKKKD